MVTSAKVIIHLIPNQIVFTQNNNNNISLLLMSAGFDTAKPEDILRMFPSSSML